MLWTRSLVVGLAVTVLGSVQYSCGQDRQGLSDISSSQTFLQFRANRLKLFDPKTVLAADDHERLWKANIELAFRCEVDNKIKLDQFGMAGTSLFNQFNPNACAEFMKLVNEEIIGLVLAREELVEMLLKLKTNADKDWEKKRHKDFPSLIFRAELVKAHARVQSIDAVAKPGNQTWLLINVFPCEHRPEDLVVAYYRSRIKNESRGSIDSRDSRTYIQYKPPHPKYTGEYEMPKLKPNRQQPLVSVADDGLSRRERELEFGFIFTDRTGFVSHQIEGVTTVGDVDQLDPRIRVFLEHVDSHIKDRLPNGSQVSPNELHLRIGSVAKALSEKFPNYSMDVSISEHPVGDMKYSRITIGVLDR